MIQAIARGMVLGITVVSIMIVLLALCIGIVSVVRMLLGI